jgi:subtilisin family serine protease
MQHRKARSSHNHFEQLEGRQMLAAHIGDSKRQILAEVAGQGGLNVIRNFIQQNPNSQVARHIKMGGSSAIYRTKQGSLLELRLKSNGSISKAVKAVRAIPGVRMATPDRVYSVPQDAVPNDPRWKTSQVLRPTYQQLGIDKAWDVTKGSSNVVVAVLDDGVDTTHEDLQGALWVNKGEIAGDGIDNDNNGYVDDINGWDFTENSNNINPRVNPEFNSTDSHGTIVAGLIGARIDNEVGMAGVAGGGTQIMPIRWRGATVDFTVQTSALAKAIVYAVNNGAKIINLSWTIEGFLVDSGFQSAINFIRNRNDVLWFNSAGNQDWINPERQTLGSVFVVANADRDDLRYKDSNTGWGIDVTAYGTDVLSTVPGQRYFTATGTSFANAITSGAAALVWAANPTWNREQVAAALINSATNIDAKNPSYAGC